MRVSAVAIRKWFRAWGMTASTLATLLETGRILYQWRSSCLITPRFAVLEMVMNCTPDLAFGCT
jgi:hypothetical protein